MLNVTEWAWVLDKTFVVCRYVDNKVVVEIERTGNTRIGEVQDFPMELFGKITGFDLEENVIEKLVRSAADDFFRAYLGEI